MEAPDSSPACDQLCGTCLHWRPEQVAGKFMGWGQCRRLPPTMPPIQDDKLVHIGLWPHTREGDWCGEWQAVVPPEQPGPG